jgi:hypothetical protein
VFGLSRRAHFVWWQAAHIDQRLTLASALWVPGATSHRQPHFQSAIQNKVEAVRPTADLDKVRVGLMVLQMALVRQ